MSMLLRCALPRQQAWRRCGSASLHGNRCFSSSARVFSGIQPTGTLHLGNYLGAVRNWIQLIEEGTSSEPDVLLSVVDLHAITVQQDPAQLRAASLDMLAMLIACGVDPDKAILFIQSHVPQHTELGWLLTCHTPLSFLKQMTQFKEKSRQLPSNSILPSTSGVSAGLFMYPVLQAADILLYNAKFVPVGEDQRQHIELTRDIATQFNNRYNAEVFVVPEAVVNEQNPRVMSLRDGCKKMSKSELSDLSRINLTDDADAIAKKIKKAKSDTAMGVLLPYDEVERPERANMARIYAAVTNQSLQDACQDVESHCSGSTSAFKSMLVDALIEHLAPIRTRYQELSQDEAYLESVAARNAERARTKAQHALKQVKRAIGLIV